MVDSRYSTLIIIEGEQCERAFFKKFVDFLRTEKNTEIVSFSNDIYELYKHIVELGDTDTKSVILNYCKIDDKTRKKLRETKFVNIYLVFDLDIQDGYENEREIKLKQVAEMLSFFNDETGDYGKLLVNYPMMESYRHLDLDNPNSLNGKAVEVDNYFLSHEYKCLVGQEGTKKNIGQYNSNDFYNTALAHLSQANLLLHGEFKKPNHKQYEEVIKIGNIHSKQSDQILNNNKMFVLNTSIFIFSEFYPNMINAKGQ